MIQKHDQTHDDGPSSPCKAPADHIYTRHLSGAQVAQLVEQRIENPRVTGSIPVLGTILSPK